MAFMTSCASASLSVCLVITLEGVQVGFEGQGADVGEVSGSVQVEACQDLHISNPGRMMLQQVFNPLGIILSTLQIQARVINC